jgi:hypothetical protein
LNIFKVGLSSNLEDFESGYVPLLTHLKMVLAPPTRWEIQCEILESLRKDSRLGATLQLALCHYLGFGVRPDLGKMVQLLEASTAGNVTAMALYHRFLSALETQLDSSIILNVPYTDLDKKLSGCTEDLYFSSRICQHQQLRSKSDISQTLANTRLENLPLDGGKVEKYYTFS